MTTPTYRTHEFATLTGVTIKALHHYDRVGLLTPRRAPSGYRLYTDADATRLQRIVALKFLGLPLRRIKDVLSPGGPPLQATLRQQRTFLEGRRRLLDVAIRALAQAEAGLDERPGAAHETLARLMTVISMQDSIDAMRKYYSDEAWAVWRQHYEEWPSAAWVALYRDLNAALDADPPLSPTSDQAQALGARWLELDKSQTSIPAVRTGLRRSWADRQQWPEAMRQRLHDLDAERAIAFANDILWERWEAERLAREQGGARAPARVSEARRQLYRDGAAALGADPASDTARAIAERWSALVDLEVGGDGATRAEVVDAWRRRRHWPSGLKRYMASCYEMDADTWLRVADFIEAAYDRAAPSTSAAAVD